MHLDNIYFFMTAQSQPKHSLSIKLSKINLQSKNTLDYKFGYVRPTIPPNLQVPSYTGYGEYGSRGVNSSVFAEYKERQKQRTEVYKAKFEQILKSEDNKLLVDQLYKSEVLPKYNTIRLLTFIEHKLLVNGRNPQFYELFIKKNDLPS